MGDIDHENHSKIFNFYRSLQLSGQCMVNNYVDMVHSSVFVSQCYFSYGRFLV